MRPRSLDEVVGQEHLTFPGSPLRQLVEATAASRTGPASVILWGPPGVGKTTLAHVISHAEGRAFVELSAITAGVKDVRTVVENARRAREMYGQTTVLFLDEIHRFSKAQQDALLPAVENRLVVLVAATTENPSFSVISPLLSRSLLLTLKPLDDAAVGALVDRACTDPRGLAGEFALTEEAREMVVRVSGADARRSLTVLEAACGIARARAEAGEDDGGEDSAGVLEVGVDDVAEAASEAVLRYDRNGDQHYDVISAFIKSIRGSDPDAALHYLARMIVAGEDPRFICRRLVVHAAEDIGMADPQALVVAVSAQSAVERIGMPEGRIPMAEATVYLATAPKSNAACTAIEEAIADVKEGRAGQVPMHLRDSHYPGAAALGHGEGYRYPHDWPYAVAPQQYLPDTLTGRQYYRPTPNGGEARMAERLETLARLRTQEG
ncbi:MULTISPECIES: replication-associated recombination protein A [Brevibacterium]|uniref:Replication-associated recombination protein A n=1 Tax=Brevibacterium salitolerans TaxID=1403566 RepID=A0ABN2WET3_9MICO|nr:replication-associated recombination protein A [Brevibacterium sp.]